MPRNKNPFPKYQGVGLFDGRALLAGRPYCTTLPYYPSYFMNYWPESLIFLIRINRALAGNITGGISVSA